MILETVVFTALPTSRTADALYLNCFMAPRLGGVEGNPSTLPLSRYVDFASGEWARIVTTIDWTMTLRWGDSEDSDEQTLRAARISADPDPALFAVMFPTAMPVVPFTYDNIAKRPMLSFPLARLAQALDDVQVRIARESPEDRPAKSDLVTAYQKDGQRPPDTRPLDGFNLDPQRRATLSTAIDRMLERNGVTTAPAAGSPSAVAGSVEQLNRMLAPDNGPQPPPLWPDLDFHQAVSLLASHPMLMRKLGFIVDLKVPLAGWTKRLGTPRVYVGSSWPGSYDPDARGVDITTAFPRVLSRLADKTFRPSSKGTWLRDDGFVDARSLSGVTSEVEVEIQATQTEATAISRAQQDELDSFGSATHAGTPTRHSTGIAVVQTDYAAHVKTIMLRQDAFNDALRAGDDQLVEAEDVLAGYRLDVRKVGEDSWRTVHRRHGTLTPYVGRQAQAPVDLGDDEGWMEPAGSSGSDEASAVRMSESLARWLGWSLALPAPGKLLDQDSRAADPIGPDQGWEVIDSLHGVVDYAAPASGARLPLLRFGKTDYEMRLRWVDMAGNSVSPESVAGSTLAVPFRRQDAVASPGVYLAEDPLWGESVDVVVLRTAATLAQTRTISRRYVAPPSVSAELALLHGMFDDAQGRPRVDSYDTIAQRESAAFPSEVLSAKPAAVPYLADPLAHALFVRGVPVSADAFTAEASLEYGGTWPAMRVLEIVADGKARPGASTIGTRMTIGVPQGRVLRLRLSNGLTQQGLELLDLWRRSARFGAAARARAGAWWQLTPDRTLVVVHAVQQPLLAPAFVTDVRPAQAWRATRAADETAASLAGRVAVDAPSTASIDIAAVGSWFVDDGPGSGTPYVAVQQDLGVLGTALVEEPAPGTGRVNAYVGVRAPLADTRRVGVILTATAASRFAEYFRLSESFVVADAPVVVNGGEAVVPDTAQVTYVSQVKADPVTASAQQYSFDPATATFRRVTVGLPAKDQIPAGATVTVSFIPDPITRSSRQAPAPQRTVSLSVPSSARPAAPEVATVLPTFRWASTAGARPTSTRTGGGLRIYLRRPWGSSGLNEDLGVVLLSSRARGASDPAEDLVTRWGQDPTTMGQQPPSPLALAGYPGSDSFRNASAVARRVRLPDGGPEVDVVRFEVGAHDANGVVSGYDADRDMWFADIEMDAGTSYRPMLQLALVRYQAVSVPGLEVSPVTMLDVVQLEPDRVASLSLGQPRGGNVTATVSLSGPSYRSNDYGSGPGRARVILERHLGGNHARSGSSAAWTQVRSAWMTSTLARDGIATWNGTINVPDRRANFEYRLVFEQYETLRNDGMQRALRENELLTYQGLRLVHTDLMYLASGR